MSTKEIERILNLRITKKSIIEFLKLKYVDKKISAFDEQHDIVINPLISQLGSNPKFNTIRDIYNALKNTKSVRKKYYKTELAEFGLSQIAIALSCTDKIYRRNIDLTDIAWKTVHRYLLENNIQDIYVETKCLSLNSAIIRPRILHNSILFFRQPCLEFWVSLCQLVEAIIFNDSLVYLTGFEKYQINDNSFSSLFFKEELNEALIKNNILRLGDKSALLNQQIIENSFLKYEGTINQVLSQDQELYELADLFNDSIGIMAVENSLYTNDNFYKFTRTDPYSIYYQKRDPQAELRELSLETVFMALSLEIDREVIYDPLRTQNLMKLYEKNVAKKNYSYLKETIDKSFSDTIQPMEKFSMVMDPLLSVILKRVQKNKKGFFDELLELRDSFSNYRKIMNDYKESKPDLTYDQLLNFRYKWVDSVQKELEKNWSGKKNEYNFFEFLEISVGNNEVLLTVGVNSLLKMITQGIKSIMLRKRTKPFISISRQLKQIECSFKTLQTIFNWIPNESDFKRLNKLSKNYEELLNCKDYLNIAKKEFLDSHGHLTEQFSVKSNS